MSLSFTSPFYSLADFDRLFDEAFNSRTSALVPRERNETTTRPMRPRYVPSPAPFSASRRCR